MCHITFTEECVKDKNGAYITNEMIKTWDSIWGTKRIEEELLNIKNDIATPLFKRYLPTSGRILEAGCGLGKWVIYLRRLGYDIIGVDFSSRAIESIKKYGESIPVKKADVINLPYRDNSFSAYVSLGVIEHFVEGPQAALKEAHRVLKPEGLLFLSVPIHNIISQVIISPLEKTILWVRRNGYLRQLLGKRPLIFFQYLYSLGELVSFLKGLSFEVFFIKPIYHREGLLDIDNRLFRVFSRRKSDNSRLNKIIAKISFYLEQISPYLTPFGIILLARAQKP